MSVTVKKVMEKLIATKTHRIWVVSEGGQLEGVVSMTDIIRYLCKPSHMHPQQGDSQK